MLYGLDAVGSPIRRSFRCWLRDWHVSVSGNGDYSGRRLPIDQGFDEWYGIPNTTTKSLYTQPPVSTTWTVGHAPSIMEGRKGALAEVLGDYDVMPPVRQNRRRAHPCGRSTSCVDSS